MIASFGMALRYSFDMARSPTSSMPRSRRCWRTPAHRGYQVRGHHGRQHHADGRSDPEGVAGAARLSDIAPAIKNARSKPGIFRQRSSLNTAENPADIRPCPMAVQRLAVERAILVLAREGLRRRERIVGEFAVAGQDFDAGIEPGTLGDVDAGMRPCW